MTGEKGSTLLSSKKINPKNFSYQRSEKHEKRLDERKRGSTLTGLKAN